MHLSERRLGELAEILAGVPGLGQEGKYAFKVIQPNSFSDTGMIEAPETQFRGDNVSPKLVLQVNDILIKRLNHSFVYVVAESEAGSVASQNLLIVRPGPEIDPQYLAFVLEQKEVTSLVEHVSGTSAAIKAISQKKLAEIMIPVIPMAEQQKIGEIWRLSRKRKSLLREYIAETDRLISVMASRITTGGEN